MPNYFVIYFDASKPDGGGYEAIKGPNSDTSFTATDGQDANGLAAITTRKQGKFVSFDVTEAVATITTTQEIAESTTTTF